MKTLEKYICEFCGTEYSLKTSAVECENNHHKPVSFKQMNFLPYKTDHSGYPHKIFIQMDNGEIVEYKR